MRYLILICMALLLASCHPQFHQSRYTEHQRKIISESGMLGYETIGSVDDDSTFIFGRLKVLDEHDGKDITRLCKFVGLSNKYYRLSGMGPKASHPKDDSLFYNTRPNSNVHIETGLFGVHMKEGYVGVHHHRQHSYGGVVKCKKKNRTAELEFKSRVPKQYTKTYIGDITVKFFKGKAFEFTVEDKMEETYADLVKIMPSADNEKVKLVEALAKKF